MKTSLSHLIIAIVLCVAAIASYSVWYAALSAKSTLVANLQNQIDTKNETVKRISTTRASLAGVASDEAIVQDYFVPETRVVAFINSLEAQGTMQKTAVSVLSVSTGGTAVQPTLELSLTVTGTFDAVMRTVGAIEFVPYDLSISELSITQNTDVQNAKNSWRADLTLLVGSVPATRAVATPSGPDALGTIIP